MILISSLDKTKKERLTHFKGFQRKWKVNNLHSISFSVFRNDVNAAAFDLIEEEIEIEYDGTIYIVKDLDELPLGNTVQKIVSAEHEMFTRLIDDYTYTVLANKSRSINEYLSFALQDTDYTFSVIDSFVAETIENFGDDNPLALLNKITDVFLCEFDVVGKEIRIYERIGSQTSAQYRYKHNISGIVKKGTSRNLSTYIKGFGKEYEEKDKRSGEHKNLEQRTGVWEDTTDIYWYTKEVGATFKMVYTGTGVRFAYYADPTGGVWEFTMGTHRAELSTWAETPGVKAVDLFRDSGEQGTRTIVATFKGDDPKHVPSTGAGTAKGWVRHSADTDAKTFESYMPRIGDERFYAVAEYTSPLSSVYGIRHQKPLYDDRYTDEASLQARLEKEINDKPEISHEMTFTDLQAAGYSYGKPKYGDGVAYIVEPLDLLIPDVRIMEITEYLEEDKSPDVVLGNSATTYGESVFNTAKAQLDQIFDSRKNRIRNNVLEEAVKRATEALNNSLTELEYPVGMGILARDPNDENRFVVLRSSGIGVTTDGGVTFPNAITPDGVVTNLLTAGQIKTNNIQIIGEENLFYWDGVELIAINPYDANKYVQLTSAGLYVAKGAITIERPDGYQQINDGMIKWDLGVQAAEPRYGDPGVTVEGNYWVMTGIDYLACQFYTFEHKARYIKFHITQYVDTPGEQSYVVIQTVEGSSWVTQAVVSSTNTDPSLFVDISQAITVDLGVPTGARKSARILLRSTSTTAKAGCRVARKWLEG